VARISLGEYFFLSEIQKVQKNKVSNDVLESRVNDKFVELSRLNVMIKQQLTNMDNQIDSMLSYMSTMERAADKRVFNLQNVNQKKSIEVAKKQASSALLDVLNSKSKNQTEIMDVIQQYRTESSEGARLQDLYVKQEKMMEVFTKLTLPLINNEPDKSDPNTTLSEIQKKMVTASIKPLVKARDDIDKMYNRMVEKNQIVDLRSRLTTIIDISAVEMRRKIKKLQEHVLKTREISVFEELACFRDKPRGEQNVVNCWQVGDLVSSVLFEAGVNRKRTVDVCCCELHRKTVLDHFGDEVEVEIFDWINDVKTWRFHLINVVA
jgi:hypothetical protein